MGMYYKFYIDLAHDMQQEDTNSKRIIIACIFQMLHLQNSIIR